MIQNQTNQHEALFLEQNIPIILCSYCKTKVPKLYLKQSYASMKVYSECPCTKEIHIANLNQFIKDLRDIDKTEDCQCANHANKASRYCIECSQWLCQECIESHSALINDHLLVKHKLDIMCNQHRIPFLFYCRQCLLNICDNCRVSTHHNHITIPIKLTEQEPQLDEFNKLMKKNKDKLDRLVKRFNGKSYLDEDLLTVYKENKQMNQNLILFYKGIQNTISLFKHYPSHELMILQVCVTIDTKEICSFETQSLWFDCQEFKRHLETLFILQPMRLIEETKTTYSPDHLVSCLIQLKDGRLVSSGKDINSIKLWNVQTNQCLTTIKEFNQSFNCLLQLKDGRMVSSNQEGVIQLWNTTTHKITSTMTGHVNLVYSLLELNNGIVASGGSDKTIRLWNVKSNQCITTLTGHMWWVDCLIQLKDTRLASGSGDNTIKLWSTMTNKYLTTLIGHMNIVKCIVQLRNSRLVSGSYDYTIKIWDIETYECITTFTHHYWIVYCIIELIDGRIAFGSDDCTIKVFNPDIKDSRILEYKDGNDVRCLFELKDGTLVSSSYKKIKRWDVIY